MTLPEIPIIEHKIKDLQGLHDSLKSDLCARMDKLETRMWVFMSTFAGGVMVAVFLALKG